MNEAPAVETDPSLLKRCDVTEPAQRIRLLRQLHDAGTPLFVSPTADRGRTVSGRIHALDTQRDTIDLDLTAPADGDPEHVAQALRRSVGAVVVTLAGGVKLQFELSDAVLLGDGTTLRLRASLPARLARIQRREAFRVSPPAQVRPRLWRRVGTSEREMPIADVSATGLAYEVPEGQPEPRIGDRLEDCRLELPDTAPIRCSLVVRGLRRPPPGRSAPVRVGCEFARLEPSAERAIQVFVNQAQVQVRQRRPMLG